MHTNNHSMHEYTFLIIKTTIEPSRYLKKIHRSHYITTSKRLSNANQFKKQLISSTAWS